MTIQEASKTVEWTTQDGRPVVVEIEIEAGCEPTYTARVAGKVIGTSSCPTLAKPIETRGVTVVGRIGDLARQVAAEPPVNARARRIGNSLDVVVALGG